MNTKRAQIFVSDVTLSAIVFVTLLLVILSIGTRAEYDDESVLGLCWSSVEAIRGNGTLAGVANGSILPDYLNATLALLPGRLGYELSLTSYFMDGTAAGSHLAWTDNATAAARNGYIASAGSSFFADGNPPLLGEARLRCWLKR